MGAVTAQGVAVAHSACLFQDNLCGQASTSDTSKLLQLSGQVCFKVQLSTSVFCLLPHQLVHTKTAFVLEG